MWAKDLGRNNFPVSSAEAPGWRSASEAVYTDVNNEEATQPAGMDPRSKPGSYSGPDPKAAQHPRLSRPGATSCLLLLVLLSGCGWQMAEQARLDPYEPTTLSANGTSAMHSPPGTVARGTTAEDDRPPIDKQLLARGRERYTITCALCHGEGGDGDGRIIARGFPQPPSFHQERLVQAPDEHFWSAITNGAGRMLPYAERVSPRDRWAIVAWIRVLQISRKGAPSS